MRGGLGTRRDLHVRLKLHPLVLGLYLGLSSTLLLALVSYVESPVIASSLLHTYARPSPDCARLRQGHHHSFRHAR